MKGIHDIDLINLCVVRLDLLRDNILLSKATGFLYSALMNDQKVYFLITNWHVVTGRHTDPPYRCLNQNQATPNRIETKLTLKPKTSTQIEQQEIFIPLYAPDGSALWLEHPDGPSLDVAAIFLGPLPEYVSEGVDVIANCYDMKIEIGNDVFILGYPLGFSHFLETPIWKKGIIASEPHLETSKEHSSIVIDATTRSGMSGAPVIMREKTHYIDEDGQIQALPNASRFIGIYSSRPSPIAGDFFPDQERSERAEIGYVIKSGAIADTIQAQRKGHGVNDIPYATKDKNT